MWSRVSTSLISQTFINDTKKVSNKWAEKIAKKDITDLDETRLKLEFTILRSKLDFIYRLGYLSDYDVLMETLNSLENILKEKYNKAIVNKFADNFIETLKDIFS